MNIYKTEILWWIFTKATESYKDRNAPSHWSKYFVAKTHGNRNWSKHLISWYYSKIGQIHQYIYRRDQWHGYPDGPWQVPENEK